MEINTAMMEEVKNNVVRILDYDRKSETPSILSHVDVNRICFIGVERKNPRFIVKIGKISNEDYVATGEKYRYKFIVNTKIFNKLSPDSKDTVIFRELLKISTDFMSGKLIKYDTQDFRYMLAKNGLEYMYEIYREIEQYDIKNAKKEEK